MGNHPGERRTLVRVRVLEGAVDSIRTGAHVVPRMSGLTSKLGLAASRATAARLLVSQPSGVRDMATKDTGGQQRANRSTEEVDEQAPEAQASDELKERQDKLSDDVDAVLDEIDEVLESNAEDFVRGFVQKG